jgi:hypothetical protein
LAGQISHQENAAIHDTRRALDTLAVEHSENSERAQS